MPTVLLIDDSKFLRRANELSLTKAGHQIVTASDGEEGLRLAREKKPDVIVLSSLPQKNELKLRAAGAAAYMEKSSLALEQSSSELSRTISKILKSTSAPV